MQYVFLKRNAIQVESIPWSKVLNKPFILMQEVMAV